MTAIRKKIWSAIWVSVLRRSDMPELPEVETIRQDLRAKLLGKKIRQVMVREKKSVRGKADVFVRRLVGDSFAEIDRVGKLMIFALDRQPLFLLVHLKMTGQLLYRHRGGLVAGGHSLTKGDGLEKAKHIRVEIVFSDGSCLVFNDLRKFGYLQIADAKELARIRAGYGIEPGRESFRLDEMKEIFARRKTNIKAVLLNQKLIAGIGNIYADEILFAARIHPTRAASSLKPEEVKRIFTESKKIIKKAIENRGTTFNNYVDSDGRKGGFYRFLRVYERVGEKCRRCGGVVKKMKLAGRGTHFCDCQE